MMQKITIILMMLYGPAVWGAELIEEQRGFTKSRSEASFKAATFLGEVQGDFDIYINPTCSYAQYSHHIEAQKAESLIEGELREKRRVACNLIVSGVESGIIATATGLTLAEIEAIKRAG